MRIDLERNHVIAVTSADLLEGSNPTILACINCWRSCTWAILRKKSRLVVIFTSKEWPHTKISCEKQVCKTVNGYQLFLSNYVIFFFKQTHCKLFILSKQGLLTFPYLFRQKSTVHHLKKEIRWRSGIPQWFQQDIWWLRYILFVSCISCVRSCFFVTSTLSCQSSSSFSWQGMTVLLVSVLWDRYTFWSRNPSWHIMKLYVAIYR